MVLHYEPAAGESPAAKLGFIHMDGDTLMYLRRVADSERAYMILEQGTRLNEGQFLLQEDVAIRVKLVLDHSGSHLAVILNEEDLGVMSSFLTSEGSLVCPVLLKLNLKESKLGALRSAMATLPASVIRRILPEQSDFPNVRDQPLWAGLEPLTKKCSPDQTRALQSMLSVPPNGPPFLLLGPRGTGKTFLLVTAVCSFVLEAQDRGFPLRVLVCTQGHKSASDFLESFHTSFSGELSLQELRALQLVPDGATIPWQHREVCTVSDFRGDRDRILKHEAMFVVSTYDTCREIVEVMPSGFFTHILLDECGQILEPECVVPLHLVGGYTRVIMCGDEYQVWREGGGGGGGS